MAAQNEQGGAETEATGTSASHTPTRRPGVQRVRVVAERFAEERGSPSRVAAAFWYPFLTRTDPPERAAEWEAAFDAARVPADWVVPAEAEGGGGSGGDEVARRSAHGRPKLYGLIRPMYEALHTSHGLAFKGLAEFNRSPHSAGPGNGQWALGSGR